MKLGLTPEQLAKRRHSIGGSDANTIMSGNTERIIALWQEKRGEKEPDDLSDVLPVQMGSFTEPFNAYWFEKTTGKAVTHCGEERTHPDHPKMTCTLDGIVYDLVNAVPSVWEAKHVSAYAKEEEVRERYMPQLHHNMMCTGTKKAYLSVFFGTMKHVVFEVEFDDGYGNALLAREAHFWECVQNGTPPAEMPAIAPPVPVSEMREVNMEGNNGFALNAGIWLENKDAAKQFNKADKELKDGLEADVKRAFGHGIEVTRTKNQRRIKEL